MQFRLGTSSIERGLGRESLQGSEQLVICRHLETVGLCLTLHLLSFPCEVHVSHSCSVLNMAGSLVLIA